MVPGLEFFGKAPVTPAFNTVDPLESQRKSIAGNIEAFPEIEKLAGLFNQFNYDATSKTLGATDPFKDQIATQLSKNRLDWSKGIVSKDLLDQVQRVSASRAVGGGFAGTGLHNMDILARTLITGDALQQRAQSSEESWLRTASSIYQPGMFKPEIMMTTPQQLQANYAEERNLKFQRDWVAEQIKTEYSLAGRAQREDEKMSAEMSQMMSNL